MNRYKQLASNTLVLALGQFGSKVLVLLMMGFYQASIGDAGFGEISVIVNTATLLMAFATLSIGESVIRYGIDKNYDNTQVFSIAIKTTVYGLLVFLLIVPALGFFGNTFPDSEVFTTLSRYKWYIYFYIFSGGIKSTCALFVRSIGYIRLYAVDGIFTTLMNVAFNLILVLNLNLGVPGYIFSVILADMCSIIFLSAMSRINRFFIFFGIDRSLLRTMLRFCIPLIPTTILWWVISVSDSYFVTEILGKAENGIYHAAYMYPNVIALFSGIFSQAWNMSAIVEKNSRTIAKFYTNVFNIFQSFVYVLAGGLLFSIRFITTRLFQGDFPIAYLYTPFIILAVSFTCFSTFMGSVYIAAQQSKRSLLTTLLGAVTNIVLNFILIPFFGLHAAAFSTFVSYLVIFIVRAIDSRKFVYMDLKLPKLITNTSILFIMGMFIIFIKDELPMYISVGIGFFLIVLLNFQSGIEAVKMLLKKESK